MADNTQISLETDGDLIATDDISGVKYQRMKLTLGADGVNDGDISKANPLPVVSDGIPLYDTRIIDESAAPATTVVTYKLAGVTVATKTITISGTTTTIAVVLA